MQTGLQFCVMRIMGFSGINEGTPMQKERLFSFLFFWIFSQAYHISNEIVEPFCGTKQFVFELIFSFIHRRAGGSP